MKFHIAAHWKDLNDHEKANIRRTLSEVAFLLSCVILGNLAITQLKNDDDDDNDDEKFWSFLAYQALRLKAEILFFVLPNQTMSILRSPMASMSFVENLIKLSGQMWNINDVYERGPWKGEPKIKKTLTNMTPGYRQYYRLRDLQDQLSWFSSKL